MKRALALYLPMWSVDLIRRRERSSTGSVTHATPADAPRRGGHATRPAKSGGDIAHRGAAGRAGACILVVGVVSQKQVVMHCCARAYTAGVRPGMALADARALLSAGRIVIRPHNPERDLASLRSLAQWALRVSPVVAIDPPDGLFMDVSGCERLYIDERRLLRRLHASFVRLGLSARAAIAPTFACARAVARFGPDTYSIIPDSDTRSALEPLPIGALDVHADVVAAFEELGVTTIAELLRLPRSDLPSRFGEDLLLRLDLALGHAVEIIDPVQPVIPVRVEQLFDGPTTQVESIELAAHELLAALSAQLATAESGVSRLIVTLDRIAAEPVRIILSLGRPSRSAKHLWALLRPRLEDANLGFGVERIELTAARTGRLRHHQTACWSTPDQSHAESDAAFWEFADTVIARLGPKSVLRPETRSTHLPERATRLRPVIDSPSRSPPPPVDGRGEPADSVGFVPQRPSLLLDPPEPVDVIALTPDGPVSRLVHEGVVHSVTQCAGPERLSPEWWRIGVPDAESPAASLATRDYFRLHTDTAHVFWVFKELETARWFLHGEWT